MLRLSRRRAEKKAGEEAGGGEAEAGESGWSLEDRRREVERLLYREVLERIGEEGAEAKKELYRSMDRVEDPLVRAYIRKVLEIEERDPRKKPLMNIAVKYINEAVKHGLHRDRERFFRFLASSLIHTAHEIAKQFPTITQDEMDKAYGIVRAWSFRGMVEPWHMIDRTMGDVLEELEKEGVEDAGRWLKHIRELQDKITQARIKADSDWKDNPNLLYSSLVSEVQGTPFEYAVTRPEEILGIEKEKEGEAPGAGILAHPDRYPALTQKILLKALVLGELQREDNGVDKSLYRVLLGLASGPGAVSSYHRLILGWLERVRGGERVSPIRLVVERLALPSSVKGVLLAYAKRVEDGVPVGDIPVGEREAFREAVERAKLEVWGGERRHGAVVSGMAPALGLGWDDGRVVLTGMLDDLARLYTGEKSVALLEAERDALQVYSVLESLGDKGLSLDPYSASEKLRGLVERSIRDPVLAGFYGEVVDYYQATLHELPRGGGLVEWLLGKEEMLVERLMGLKDGSVLGCSQARGLRRLYRLLVLLTVDETIEGMRMFYRDMAGGWSVRVAGGGGFRPVHGHVVLRLVEDYGLLRRAEGEAYRDAVLRVASAYESLFYSAFITGVELRSALSTGGGDYVGAGVHEGLLQALAAAQARCPFPDTPDTVAGEGGCYGDP